MFIAKIVIKSNSLTRKDKIILLELLGAALITRLCLGNFDEGDLGGALCGLECWREAMSLRYFPTEDGDDPLPKLPNVHVPSVLSSVIFGSAVEVATREELDLLQQDFERNYLPGVNMRIPCAKRMLIQALLVIRRISAQEDLGHPHWLYLESLFDFSRFLEDNFRIKTLLFIMEELNGFDPNLLPFGSVHVLIKTLHLLSNYFIEHLTEPPNSPRGRELNYANLLIVTKLITSIQLNHPGTLLCSFFQKIVYRLVFVMNSISSRITREEQQILETFYCDYFRDFPERKTTVLHKAVLNNIFNSMNHARLQTIKRIVKFGADPNAIDEKGQNALHILAASWPFKEDESVPLFQVLLDAGTHLDTAGDDGKTVLCILKERLEGKVHPYFESLINTVFPLSCYCARVIRRYGVPFEDRLPPRLKKLVSIHNAKGKQIIDHSSFSFYSEIIFNF
jgi:hypothetical protein